MLDKQDEKVLEQELWDRDLREQITAPKKIKKTTIKKLTDYPDAKKHQLVSFIKSTIRILGYTLIPLDLVWAASILVVSEFIGIIEELV